MLCFIYICHPSITSHLEATLLMAATRPTVLITDAWNAQTELPKRKDRHTQLIGALMSESSQLLSYISSLSLSQPVQ